MPGHVDWLDGSVIYQIYPRSFYDALGTGVGNLKGIEAKLDYLAGSSDSLGVTGIWLSPVYTSPMADFGYDVSNYTDIDPLFGTVDDLARLIVAAHERHVKVIMDFVPNHSSDQHPWFIESKSSRDNPKRDWYVWHDPAPDTRPPNNWLSVFGGSAWQYSDETRQYYLHSFLAQQPDLNWDNPAVRKAMKDALRFWLNKGVDGFRVDAIDWMSKDPEFHDNPLRSENSEDLDPNDYGSYRHSNSRGGPHLLERLREMSEVLTEYDNRFMIIEGHPEYEDKIEGYISYYQPDRPDLYAPFNFEPIHVPWRAIDFKRFIDAYQAAMRPGFTSIYTSGNHDESRIGSRIGLDAARVSAMMVLTLPGMAFLYYGEEIGMTDVSIAQDQVQDPFTLPGQGRDPERTPMQWDDQTNAGFTNVQPWLPTAVDITHINVAYEQTDRTSMLRYYRQLIRLRTLHDAFKLGQYVPKPSTDAVLIYERSTERETFVIVLNFTDSEQTVDNIEWQGTITLSTHQDRENDPVKGAISLRANEGIIVQTSHHD